MFDVNEFFDDGVIEQLKERPTRKKRKKKEQKGNNSSNIVLKSISPMTENQEKVFDSYYSGQNLVLSGSAGTGKTFLAIYLGLKDILNNVDDKKHLYIIRSAAPSRDIGFMPGNKNEKMKVFESPYYGIFSELCGRGDSYDYLKTRKDVIFESTSFLRGVTIKDSIIIVDEAQNLTAQESNTLLTRVGNNSRIILCGDYKQSDLQGKYQKSGLLEEMQILRRMKEVDIIEFGPQDIVRSGFVRSYLLAKESLDI